MIEELTGRVGCVKTHKIGDDLVQNFALCVEKIYNDGLPRLFTEWHNIVVAAQWADKTMIDKATQWLFENVYDYTNPEDQERVESFRKAMEE